MYILFTEKVKAKEYYIKDLLSNKFLFEIPDYQRAYSWTKENLKQLVEDIWESVELNKARGNKEFDQYEPYFLGSIVLCSKEYKDDGCGIYDVIDGQQRLTSIIMLIAAIRDLIDNEEYKKVLSDLIYQKPNVLMGIKESIRVKARGKEEEFFKKYILTNGGTELVKDLDMEELSEAKQNMVNAIEVFRDSFFNENGELLEEKLNEFIVYLLQKVVLVVITTESFTSAFRLFNVINARGLPLTDSDLLKSENLRVMNPEIRKEYTDIWESHEQDLGKEKLDQIIGFMRTMKLKNKVEESVYEEFSKKIFRNEPEYLGVNFVNHLTAVKALYDKYIIDGNLEGVSEEEKSYYKNLINIMREFLPYDDWMAAVIRFAEKFNDDKLVLEFVKVLEKRLVIDWVNGNSFADRLNRVYGILEVIEEKDSLEEIKEAPVFLYDLERTTAYFENALNDIDFYSKGRMMIPKYIFVRLDMEKRANEVLDYSDKIMIEHVLPRNAKEAYWKDNFSADQRRNWANKFGNLVIITGAKNTRANNKPFAEKVEQYLSKKSDFAITKEVLELSDWNMDSLKDRHESLVNRALELWTKF
ncbi:DUF262 domain-containing HNH endonuclease family protein [Clostridium perfringens]|uniref:DUF262 domain-containing protein n=1 Tax=Clostridium perfringens (strain SM101 / Type A) TaxID=289380 RepID=Q0SR26_CLOPS|nr:DUF262 domain-containing protein [Clostridium perfringens]ABG86030.1 conserved hypothetical protein [Clostridium perfringens SM101]MCG4541412.1 DUF262 domain-containing HNH endonuclease family protein [Clostridium perfringens]MCG4545968.1 DUF262 domain-containing HNH endonuclease family protein [Clostridium perfringens]MCG4553147.1 DUF262 domain-containing HNH endonuclease family protein [Clostridium perfringens]MCG4558051.1 DUF262 domain-containing HNH endonuclease family protein [Clostrid